MLHGLFWLVANLSVQGPVMLLAAARPAEPGSEQHLLSQITVDPLVTMVYPAPLTEGVFCAACHTATGGNPLLLWELSAVLAAEGVEPTAAGAAQVPAIGSRTVARRVALWLERLGPSAAALAGAVAVVGADADPGLAAALVGLEQGEALRVAGELAAIELLRPQALLVTTKTVEVRLTSAYRKLGITRRTDLAAVLPTTAAT